MYRRHNVWDEDKWDIHSDRSNYAGHSSGSSDSTKEYLKNEIYGSMHRDENKIKEGYRSLEQQEEEKDKEKEGNEKDIVDTLEQEEKYQRNKEQDTNESLSKGFQSEHRELETSEKKEKRKHHKSIDEAISKAIKEEKEVVFVDSR